VHACKLEGIIFRKAYVAINSKLYEARTLEVENLFVCNY